MSSKEKKALPPELNLATIGTSGTFGVHSLRPLCDLQPDFGTMDLLALCFVNYAAGSFILVFWDGEAWNYPPPPPPKCLIVLVELNKPVTEASSPQNRVGMPHFSDCCVATVCLTPVAFSPWGTE